MINEWWRKEASAIQDEVDSKRHLHQYAGFRRLRGILCSRAKRPGKLRSADGSWLHTKPERVARWAEYFNHLLNVPSEVNPDELGFITELVPESSLADILTFVEFVAVITKLKKGKATGPGGIDAESSYGAGWNKPGDVRALRGMGRESADAGLMEGVFSSPVAQERRSDVMQQVERDPP